MNAKKIEEFEVGKFYKKSDKQSTWIVEIKQREWEGVFSGTCIKESRVNMTEYIMSKETIWIEPKECVEISEAEFLEVKNRVLEKLKNI
ncbi:hypothetical protein [Chryseobacterium sp. MFBS3-17]|uniref:hypothetical protein n=1 Tax=Chryseobacterium sp. MFBS3-17 TaxID=2886689 RepID=UPI001D0DCCA8|nr:hypothetical protein [Chryseobacterium sp. MFBS3-17]MCC2590340.1 hypothetical protein [Chryseobacterium sp. MFBS3-17]